MLIKHSFNISIKQKSFVYPFTILVINTFYYLLNFAFFIFAKSKILQNKRNAYKNKNITKQKTPKILE